MHSHFAGVKKKNPALLKKFRLTQTDDGNMHVMGFLVCLFFSFW